MPPPTVYVCYQGFFAAIEMTRHFGDTPVLVVRGGRVLDLCQRATRVGIVEGMAVGSALTRCPGAQVRDFEQVRYGEWASRLRDLADTLSGAVEQASANELYLDAGKVPRELVRELRALPVPGHRLVAVLAPGKVLAGAIGRWQRRSRSTSSLDLVEAGCDAVEARAVIGDLPLEFISRPALAADLARLGIRTAGEVASLPPDFLTRRFGEDGYVLSRLCRGHDATRPSPGDRGVCVEMFLGEGGTSSEDGIFQAIAHLAAGLGDALNGRGCGRLRLEALGEGGWCLARDLERGRTLAGEAVIRVCLGNLWRQIRRLDIPGPVIRIRARALDISPARSEQMSLVGREQPRRAAAEVVASLRSRFPIGLGGGMSDRRELVLSHWDPLRFGDAAR